METDDTVVAETPYRRAAAPGRARGRRRVRQPDSTERGLRIAIVVVALGMTIAAGYMLTKAILDREAPPRNYWEYQLRLWQNTVRNNPQSPVGYENLGYIYLKMGRYRQAVNTMKTAIEIDPKRTMALINLGRTYKEMGQDDLAIRYLLRGSSLATVSNRAAPYFDLGEIYEKQGNEAKAVEYYVKSIKDDPTIWNTHMSLAGLYVKQGKNDLALIEYGEALSLAPGDSKTRQKADRLVPLVYEAGQKAAKEGRRSDAIRAFDAVKQGAAPGKRAAALLQLGTIYLSQKNYKKAETELLACINDGGRPDPSVLRQAHTSLAALYSAQGKRSKAREHRARAASY